MGIGCCNTGDYYALGVLHRQLGHVNSQTLGGNARSARITSNGAFYLDVNCGISIQKDYARIIDPRGNATPATDTNAMWISFVRSANHSQKRSVPVPHDPNRKPGILSERVRYTWMRSSDFFWINFAHRVKLRNSATFQFYLRLSFVVRENSLLRMKLYDNRRLFSLLEI